MNGTSTRLAMIEGLENRRLLCGTTIAAVASAGAALQSASTTSTAVRAPLAVTPAAVKAKPKKIVPTTSPSLVQDFRGTLKGRGALNQGSFTTTFDLNASAQTLTTLTARLTINGHGADAVLKGKLLSNGNFNYHFAKKGVIIALTGHVRADGVVITGTTSLQILVGSKFRLAGNYAAKAAAGT